MEKERNAENTISLERIAPYVRYVNYKIFDGGTLLPERIIYDHEFIYGKERGTFLYLPLSS